MGESSKVGGWVVIESARCWEIRGWWVRGGDPWCRRRQSWWCVCLAWVGGNLYKK